MPLFEVAILLEPTSNEEADGKLEEIIIPPTPIIAKNLESAGVAVSVKFADKLKDVDTSRMKVLVRPFVR